MLAKTAEITYDLDVSPAAAAGASTAK